MTRKSKNRLKVRFDKASDEVHLTIPRTALNGIFTQAELRLLDKIQKCKGFGENTAYYEGLYGYIKGIHKLIGYKQYPDDCIDLLTIKQTPRQRRRNVQMERKERLYY